MDDEPIDLRPHLVCLNLQQASIAGAPTTDALGAVLWRARLCLNWARAADMPVVHVHTLRAGNIWSPPIRGFEPLHTEAVIAKRTLAAFADIEWRRSVAARGRRFFLAGLSLQCDVLATALAGAEREARIVLIRDALSIDLGNISSTDDAVDAACRSLAPLIGAVCTQDLIGRYGRGFSF